MTLIQNIKIVCFVLIILLGSVGCSSTENDQPSTGNEAIEIQQILTLGGTRNESAQSVVSTSDGGYAVLGYTQSMDEDILNKTNNSYDYLLLKFSADGEQKWQKIWKLKLDINLLVFGKMVLDTSQTMFDQSIFQMI